MEKISLHTSLNPEQINARMSVAQQAFDAFPEKFSADVRQSILAGQASVGMDPYQAYLAAGQFAYSVQADESKWPPRSDPMKVIWAQALHPDKSEITLTFQNDTQFPGEGVQEFRVVFREGRAVEIKKSSSAPRENKNVQDAR